MQRRTFLKAAAASAGLAATPSIALSAIPDGPAPWRDLVRHCIEMPKVAGYFDRAYFESPSRTQIWAQTFAVWGWSAEKVCTELRNALNDYADHAAAVYWRKLPAIRQILGDADADDRRDIYGVSRVVVFKRPFWIASLRVGIKPISENPTSPALIKGEGGTAFGPCDSETRARLAGVAAAWIHKNWHTGEILGPEPPPLSRAWYAPHPPGVKMMT